MKEIIKLSTGTSYAYLSELREGYEAIKRVVDSVNERQRKDENKLLKNNLANWVADWRVG